MHASVALQAVLVSVTFAEKTELDNIEEKYRKSVQKLGQQLYYPAQDQPNGQPLKPNRRALQGT